MSDPHGTVLYVSFGKGRHVCEVVASILSAAHFRSVRDGHVRICVITDDGSDFEKLPAEVVQMPEEVAQSWRGPDDYVYNVKIHALLHAMYHLGGPVAVLDGDTYFRRDPIALFKRIHPGRALMHVRECSLGQIDQTDHADMRRALDGHAYTSRRGDELKLGTGMPCWNSGVVGVHPADAALVEEAVALSALINRLSGARTAEQMALGQLLERYTKLRGCRDIVFHYWWPPVRRDFSRDLPQLLKATAHLDPANRWAALHSQRPHHSPKFRLKRWIRENLLVPAGLRERFYPMS